MKLFHYLRLPFSPFFLQACDEPDDPEPGLLSPALPLNPSGHDLDIFNGVIVFILSTFQCLLRGLFLTLSDDPS